LLELAARRDVESHLPEGTPLPFRQGETGAWNLSALNAAEVAESMLASLQSRVTVDTADTSTRTAMDAERSICEGSNIFREERYVYDFEKLALSITVTS
jgi:hypothetical protein